MKTTLLSIVVITLTLCSAQAGLEDRTEALLKKLANYEKNEKFKTDVRIDAKRAEVAEVLRSYRDQALQAKNLDEANKIDEKLKELTAGKAVRPAEDPILGGWIWYNQMTATFFPGGIGYERNRKFRWERLDDGRYKVSWSNGSSFTVKVEGDTMTYITGNPGKICQRIK